MINNLIIYKFFKDFTNRRKKTNRAVVFTSRPFPNIAIPNCASEREVMNDEFQKKMKNINRISQLRNASTRMRGLKEAFNESMQPVINTVNARFESMKLKDDRIKRKKPFNSLKIPFICLTLKLIFPNYRHLMLKRMSILPCL